MKTVFRLILLFLMPALNVTAQHISKHYKIAVFAPVYLDSANDLDNTRILNSGFPKSILPGLEFYNGVMLAVDSLQKENSPVEVFFYDTKTKSKPLNLILADKELTDVNMIIASVTSRNELKLLADFALQKRIPLLSATFPNDGGITGNPYMVILNTTLRTHCEQLYHYIQKYNAIGNIVLIRRKGLAEDLIQSAFEETGRTTLSVPLKFKTITVSDSFSNEEIRSVMDSMQKNTIICGTLNEAFGLRLVRALSASPAYSTTAIGMPTWDGIRDLDKPDCKGVDIIYSTPYRFSRTDKQVLAFTDTYKTRYQGKPTDMAFKGFEIMYHFTRLLILHDRDLMNNLSEKNYKLFNDFDFKAIHNKKTHATEYLENFKLYFIRKANGNIKSAN